jgi:hypothetical protein
VQRPDGEGVSSGAGLAIDVPDLARGLSEATEIGGHLKNGDAVSAVDADLLVSEPDARARRGN